MTKCFHDRWENQTMKFTKMHGCGNDYILVNGIENEIDNPAELSIHLSNRHFGVGSDGLILINVSEVADYKMSMYNSDGSEGKMCGNGIRCVGKFLYDNKYVSETSIKIETLSGIKKLTLCIKDHKVDTVTVDMGEPIIDAKLIPAISDKESIIRESIKVLEDEYRITCISMGNPHCVIFVDDVKKVNIEKIGPLFEHHSMFPDRVNTEFVHVRNRKAIDIRVWERGSGETLACGTGACASVYACILNNITEDEVLVHLSGGDLLVKYDRKENTIIMTGNAKEIYEGNYTS